MSGNRKARPFHAPLASRRGVLALAGAGLASLATGATGASAATGRARLLYYGFGVRDTQYVREHWREMERMPLDGTAIVVALDRDGWREGETGTPNRLDRRVMGAEAFPFDQFAAAVADLRAARWRTFTANFLPVALASSVSASDLNWFDDPRWATITHNFSVTARIAARGGLTGLILDPEHYGTALFSYAGQRRLVDRPFADHAAAARARGRQVMAAIGGELPEAVILALFGYSLPHRQLQQGGSREDIEYALLPAFYDGLLEAMPAGCVFVDGYEFAYAFQRRAQFEEGRRVVLEQAVGLSALPELYRARVRVGFGLWIDYRRTFTHFPPAVLRRAVHSALATSDGFVWIYSQVPGFFPPSDLPPGYLDALARARAAAAG